MTEIKKFEKDMERFYKEIEKWFKNPEIPKINKKNVKK